MDPADAAHDSYAWVAFQRRPHGDGLHAQSLYSGGWRDIQRHVEAFGRLTHFFGRRYVVIRFLGVAPWSLVKSQMRCSIIGAIRIDGTTGAAREIVILGPGSYFRIE